MGKKHTSNKVIVETILATGMSHKDAAALFNVSTRWIRELLHRYREGGYQALQPRSRARTPTPDRYQRAQSKPSSKSDNTLKTPAKTTAPTPSDGIFNNKK
ncbi:helix-turn-helix domain-containing protein [Corynebacterium pseudodiphtheriticum]|nr:helix-turn-helix domain-containing protein [Corynebacterium pseudodiphtheriticum]MDK8564120.1 helix-turn-helix domain-containing protein [Corynebacterium pseudodiphtheriticum]